MNVYARRFVLCDENGLSVFILNGGQDEYL